eukprot:gene2984-12992_t
MKDRGHGDALELELHELEWDSLAAGVQAASGGLHQRDLLEDNDEKGDWEDREHAQKYGGSPLEALHKRIVPTKADIAAKKLLPNCTRCYGCTSSINTLKSVAAFGQKFGIETEASPEWVFTATLPEGSRQDTGESKGKVMIKVWCMPIDKVHHTMNWACKGDDRRAMRANQFLLAQQRVVEECGLLDATTKVWIDPVGAIVPEYGVHIWWNGLWMERADGISMNQLAHSSNRTRVVKVALMDLLTSQCDRHGENVFINEQGNIKVIDNLQAMKFSWESCGADSIVLPGTAKNEIVRFGGEQVNKRYKARVKKNLNPMLLLVYRCYVDGGEIGINYPPELTKCLAKIASMSAQEVTQEYKFPMLRNGQALTPSATWGHQPGGARNRERLWPPMECLCRVPTGDPYSGREWHNKYPDPGKFVGGTRFEW